MQETAHQQAQHSLTHMIPGEASIAQKQSPPTKVMTYDDSVQAAVLNDTMETILLATCCFLLLPPAAAFYSFFWIPGFMALSKSNAIR